MIGMMCYDHSDSFLSVLPDLDIKTSLFVIFFYLGGDDS